MVLYKIITVISCQDLWVILGLFALLKYTNFYRILVLNIKSLSIVNTSKPLVFRVTSYWELVSAITNFSLREIPEPRSCKFCLKSSPAVNIKRSSSKLSVYFSSLILQVKQITIYISQTKNFLHLKEKPYNIKSTN